MKEIIMIVFVVLSISTQAQILITTNQDTSTPNANAVLDLSAADKALIVPRLTTTAIEALKTSNQAAEGMIVYNIEKKCFLGYESTDWNVLGDPCIGTPPPPRSIVAFEGAFAFTGMRASNPDIFSMITLVDIPAGEVFYLTDSGWKKDGNDEFRTSEGLMKWTVTQPIAARTEIVFESPQLDQNVFEWTVSSGHGTLNVILNSYNQRMGPSLTKNGDNMIVFTATDESNPYGSVDKFIAALKLEGSWNTEATTTSTSAIPPGLVEDVTALALEADGNNQVVSCTNITSGMTDEQIRLVLNEHTNWRSFPNSEDPIPTGCPY